MCDCDRPWRRIEAHAGTGSRYVVSVVPAVAARDGGSWLVVVRQPWVAAYEFNDSQYLTLDYMLEKLGKPGRLLTEYHGGDVYALLKCLELLIDASFPAPEVYEYV